MEYILNKEEVSKALGIHCSALTRKYQNKGFPKPRFQSGQRHFWKYTDLPKLKEWFEADGHFNRKFTREESKEKNEGR